MPVLYIVTMNGSSPLEIFHPLVRRWFAECMGDPTDVQAQAWPEIAAGNHVLVTAPTGSGKTLAAFLWALDRLITGAWPGGQIRVLYVSPLKALGNDVRQNLIRPLDELRGYFAGAGEDFPDIDVQTRSGDTPADERRRMLRRPPEILITTPESLNILLSSRNGRSMLAGIKTVILDEIHAVAGTKRGTHLITAVERLTLLSGEFQRVSLSATVKPAEAVADFVGGYTLRGTAPDYHYEKRKVTIIRSGDRKRYSVRVSFPADAREKMVDNSWWPALIDSFKKIIAAHRSTLLFANSRRTVERMARLINEEEPEPLAYSHHGSLSREIRLAVEQKLKSGGLRAIVATSSLELGIDIGDLDSVVLIQTPPAISSALQRIGRSGHGVGRESRGLIFPTHGMDFIDAAVMAKSVMERDIEPIPVIEGPLDVLAQTVLSMTGIETWDIDALFGFIKTAYPYRDLTRRQFDLVLDMLAGRYAGTRLRELRPRVIIDKIDNTITAREGTLRLIYSSGGAIPDRGYFDLRVQDTRAKIGELDEEFVWERRVGETFAFGTQVWYIRNITHNDVEVAPSEARPGIIPFWKAEEQNRDFYLSERIAAFIEDASGKIDDPAFAGELGEKYFMDPEAADELIGFLERQREATGAELPHRHHLIIEHFEDPANTSQRKQVILHTLWGGRVNRPFALALSAAWEEEFHYRLEMIESNDNILLMLPHGFSAGDIFTLVTPENVEGLFRRSLEETGFFGARFRENAGIALLLPRSGFRKRLPLWLNRLRSKKLMNAVLDFPDFPILLETWRTCMQDEFDLDSLKRVLDEIREGTIRVSETATAAASPFAGSLVWKQTNTYMYQDDTPPGGKRSMLSEELLREVMSSSRLRPLVPEKVIALLEEKLRRTAPGYAPRNTAELLDWTRERIMIPADEWAALLDAASRDAGDEEPGISVPEADRIAFFTPPGSSVASVAAVESLPRIAKALGMSPDSLSAEPLVRGEDHDHRLKTSIKHLFSRRAPEDENDITLAGTLLQWLAFYGPVGTRFIKSVWGIDDVRLAGTLDELSASKDIVADILREGSDAVEVCDRENLEILLRMARRARRPEFRALGIESLPLFLAAWQGLAGRGDSVEAMQERLDALFGWPAPAAAWEEYILPARLEPYYGNWLDGLLQTSGLIWFGCGKKKISFAFQEDLELFHDPDERKSSTGDDALPDRLFPDARGRYSLFDIAGHAGLDTAAASEKLWDMAWHGLISNDSFEAMRKGITGKFEPKPVHAEPLRGRRTGLNRWSASRPLSGHWYALDYGAERDPVEREEIVKDRVRVLFRRYGVLFREIVTPELPAMQWGKVFRTLRLMELSGEVMSGYFFEGIPGIQFISHEAFRFLSQGLPEDAVYWMNAADPASLCGVKLEGLKGLLPARLSATHVVFHGRRPVIISKRNGKALEISMPPENPILPECLSFFKAMLSREFEPMQSVLVETVNGVPASQSDYARVLRDFGFEKHFKGLMLRRRF